ncbi:P-loop containing nucleoside triphosphate hydrolase protein [Crassisporium funariophilum]|nr:P-loop containing nucleoside triphosphate hydrolase protein [Crassisporium funariophilum]
MTLNGPTVDLVANINASPTSNIDIESLLCGLNPAQLKAVKHQPDVPLQILAGPGSGKTKVLTSRIAYLILIHSIPPSAICSVTFTNKAANEMRERLTKLIGKESTTALQMGTFHSLCARFIRQHCHALGLQSNFTICDADESKKVISALLKPYKDSLIANDISFSEGSALSIISKAKAKGHTAAVFYNLMEEAERSKKSNTRGSASASSDAALEKKTVDRIVAEIYMGYERTLKDNNALDFDDLLVYGVRLFTEHGESVLWCRHILVDEFQDTNTMQYELMKAIAIRRCVTIVGDPDQSIYGWRSAEVINLSRMREQFVNTHQIFLEQNYRSTASILRSCLAIVAEDKDRIPKSLHTSHPLGTTPVLRSCDTEKEEADFIAYEIKRCVANMGGVLRWGDFVVLLRFNALSRPIESALQKQGIPCRILGGHKFFERMEIKDLLAYLQLVDNPNYNPAFVRAVKVPTKGTGDKTLAELAAQAERLNISQLEVVEKIHDNRIPDIKPPIRRKLASFVQTIRTLRRLVAECTPPSELIHRLVEMIDFESHLRKTQQDWESRWENVKELITFASEVESDVPVSAAPSAERSGQQLSPQALAKKHDAGDLRPRGRGPSLRQFLQASMLSSEGDNQTEEESKEKVTLSTCHAAKGLEWPVVMVPSVDQDTFPFYRTEDIEEERRLLYVACTRAQSLLYLLHASKRQVAGQTKQKRLSDFVTKAWLKNEVSDHFLRGLFSYDVPRFIPADRTVISQVLNRPTPDAAEVQRRIKEL